MKDEIKEILDKLSSEKYYIQHSYCRLFNYEANLLLDYITNLQQENISLAKENEQEKQFIKDCGFENVQQLALDYIGIRQEKEDYKLCCEKAIEYIKSYKNDYAPYELSDYNIRELLNILNGKGE